MSLVNSEFGDEFDAPQKRTGWFCLERTGRFEAFLSEAEFQYLFTDVDSVVRIPCGCCDLVFGQRE